MKTKVIFGAPRSGKGTWVRANNAAKKETEIQLSGYIVDNNDAEIYRWFGYSVVCPADIAAALKSANDAPVTIRINSPGGDVWAGSDIYTGLKDYPGHVTTKIVGLAASAASIVAIAGDEVLISPTGEMMIHNPWGNFSGDYRDLEHAAKAMKTVQDTLINAYRLKTGMPEDELRALLEAGSGDYAGTWMDAKEAVAKGFADRILYDDTGLLTGSGATAGIMTPMRAAWNCMYLPPAHTLRSADPSAPTPDPTAPPGGASEAGPQEFLRAQAKMLALL